MLPLKVNYGRQPNSSLLTTIFRQYLVRPTIGRRTLPEDTRGQLPSMDDKNLIDHIFRLVHSLAI